jgi:hypothetical protein
MKMQLKDIAIVREERYLGFWIVIVSVHLGLLDLDWFLAVGHGDFWDNDEFKFAQIEHEGG